MSWLVIISSILAAALMMGGLLYFVMTKIVKWMDDIEKENQDKEIQ